MNKTAVREQILLRLRAELKLQAQAAQLSRDEAISEESRAENRWDTHSQEAAYLAEGQARLVAEISANIEFYETLALPAFGTGAAVGVGALVEVESGDERTLYFVGPRGGGLELEIDGRAVFVITPQSPLGRELLGKRVGDTVPLPRRGVTASHRIAAIL